MGEMNKTYIDKESTQNVINALNVIAGNIEEEVHKEKQRPKYILRDNVINYENDIETFLSAGMERDKKEIKNGDIQTKIYIKDVVKEAEEWLKERGYEVHIVENLDCKDVNEDKRYYISITYMDKITTKIDFLDYQKRILDYEFDEVNFFEKEISKITGTINKTVQQTAIVIADYISCITYFRVLYTKEYSTIGWEKYRMLGNKTDWIFKYNKIFTNIDWFSIDSHGAQKDIEELSPVNPEEECNEEKKWVEQIIKLIERENPMDALLFGAGVSGIVRQLLTYTKETNININIVGEPASGKSTICHYILSIFGNPEFIEGSFSDTDNAVEERRVQRPILPYILDDRMLKWQGESELAKRRKVLADIFREYEGRVKDRVGKQNESSYRTYGPIISSSVKEMMQYLYDNEDLGQFRRFMEFDIGGRKEQVLFDDNKQAEETEKIAYGNYGYGIRIIITYMLQLMRLCGGEDYIQERFEKLKNDIGSQLSKLEGINGATSSAGRFALIVLSYQILREALLYYKIHLNGEEEGIEQEEGTKQEKTNSYKSIKELEHNETICIGNGNKKITIKDVSNSIRKKLIVNLCDKMRKIENDYDEKLYNYIMKYDGDAFIKLNKKELPAAEFKKLAEINLNIVGYYYINEKDNTMILYTLRDFALDLFWSMMKIPEIDTIRKYCAEIKPKIWEKIEEKYKLLEENDENFKPLINERSKASKYAIDKYGASNTGKFVIGRSNRRIKKQICLYLSILTIKIKNEQDEEVGD